MEEVLEQIGRMMGEELDEVQRAVWRRRGDLEGSGGSEGGGSSEVVEYRPYDDGMLQAQKHAYVRADGSRVWRGPYWYFRYHAGGRQRMLYVGKTHAPEAVVDRKRGKG